MYVYCRYISFSMAVTGWRRALTHDDLWRLNEEDSSAVLINQWDNRWIPRVNQYLRNKEKTHIKDHSKIINPPCEPSIVWCLFLSFKHLLIPATVLKVIADTLLFINPMLLQYNFHLT